MSKFPHVEILLSLYDDDSAEAEVCLVLTNVPTYLATLPLVRGKSDLCIAGAYLRYDSVAVCDQDEEHQAVIQLWCRAHVLYVIPEIEDYDIDADRHGAYVIAVNALAAQGWVELSEDEFYARIRKVTLL